MWRPLPGSPLVFLRLVAVTLSLELCYNSSWMTMQSRHTGLRVREGAHPPGPQLAELAGPRAHSGLLVPI